MLNIVIVSSKNNTLDEKIMVSKNWLKWGKPFDCEKGFLAVNHPKKPVRGVCIPEEYDSNETPNNDYPTKVFMSMSHQKLLRVDERDNTFTVDLKVSSIWADDRIKTKLKETDSFIELPIDQQLPKIWLPMTIHTANLKELTYINDPYMFTDFRFLRDKRISSTSAVINFTVEIRSTLYCDFDFRRFPFDTQTCECQYVSMNPKKLELMLLDLTNHSLHSTKNYEAAGFDVTVKFYNGEKGIGFEINLKRILFPYFLQYYFPCFGIVMVSFISFIVPLSAIPGRVGLMVTQFLTLTNIFIHQIVSK